MSCSYQPSAPSTTSTSAQHKVQPQQHSCALPKAPRSSQARSQPPSTALEVNHSRKVLNPLHLKCRVLVTLERNRNLTKCNSCTIHSEITYVLDTQKAQANSQVKKNMQVLSQMIDVHSSYLEIGHYIVCLIHISHENLQDSQSRTNKKQPKMSMNTCTKNTKTSRHADFSCLRPFLIQ